MARLPQPGADNGTWGDILNDYLSRVHNADGTLKADSVSAAQIQNGSVEEAQLSSAVQTKLNAVAGTPDWTDITNKPATFTPTAHTHTASQISDSTATGRNVLTAADAAAARTAIGAGTSNLVIGTTNTTAKAGDYAPTKADVGLGNVDNTSDATKNSAVATLTNKTISGTNNTLSNISQSAVTNLTADLAAKAAVAAVPVRFAATTALLGVTPTDRAYVARTLTGARMRVASAPVGSALTVQVQHWDGSSWTTLGTLSIADGSTIESVVSFSQAQTVGNMVRLNVTSIGATNAATGVAVDVLWS